MWDAMQASATKDSQIRTDVSKYEVRSFRNMCHSMTHVRFTTHIASDQTKLAIKLIRYGRLRSAHPTLHIGKPGGQRWQ